MRVIVLLLSVLLPSGMVVAQASDDAQLKLRTAEILESLNLKIPQSRIDDKSRIGGIRLTVSPELLKPAAAHPISPDRSGQLRQVAALRKDRKVSLFVENELILVSPDMPVLEAIGQSLDAKTIATHDVVVIQGKDKRKLYLRLIRIDASRFDDPDIFRHIERAVPGAYEGIYELSSPDARATLSLATALHRDGKALIGINWLGRPHSLENEILIEGVLPSNAGFVNPFLLNYLNGTGAAAVGVTDAWHLMKAAGVLDSNNFATPPHQIVAGVADTGFWSGVDVTNPTPNGGPLDLPASTTCTGGFTCLWHGSNTAETMAARLGNAKAVAGPAGPVVSQMILQNFEGYETWSLIGWIAGLGKTTIERPRVVSMSFGYTVPALFEWSTTPLDVAALSLEPLGVLLVAASGNVGEDIDETYCPESSLANCYEIERKLPCELTGVICVGALRANSTQRRTDSNFGSGTAGLGKDANTVDLYAPGSGIFVGADPQFPGQPNDSVQSASGTSIAAPLAAGVAALITAVDPALSPSQVANLLLSLASTNEIDLPDSAVADDTVNRWLNASRPVRQALLNFFPNSDFAPVVRIVDPMPGVFGTPVVDMGTPVTVTARAVDVEAGVPCCTIEWSIDGAEQTALSGATVEMTFGEDRNYTIGVTITDTAGQTASDTMTVRARP
ncbi:MAG: S8 family serine peptidase [Candidatus Thiodiazotropha sp. (ex Monitilora ramsayi)]|nr:S8 family serine peptidase [Candidatus Thiodiazotropha sp. (ex Monitilora ramsayi)]